MLSSATEKLYEWVEKRSMSFDARGLLHATPKDADGRCLALKRLAVAPAEGLLTVPVLKHARAAPNRRPRPKCEHAGRASISTAARVYVDAHRPTELSQTDSTNTP